MSSKTFGCKVEWCTWIGNKNMKWEYYFRKWYCQMHYKRNHLYGDVNFIKRKGASWNSKNQLYKTYLSMKQRCTNPNEQRYENYGWRGISVCERWLWVEWFDNFIADMWERPQWTSIDRIDNNWNYCKENCRWATIHEQAANQSNNLDIVGVRTTTKGMSWKAYLAVWWKLVLSKTFRNKEDAIKARREAEEFYLK